MKSIMIGPYELIPRDVSREMPHMPTEEMIRNHEWYVYKHQPSGLGGTSHLLVYSGIRSACEAWVARERAKDEVRA